MIWAIGYIVIGCLLLGCIGGSHSRLQWDSRPTLGMKVAIVLLWPIVIVAAGSQ